MCIRIKIPTESVNQCTCGLIFYCLYSSFPKVLNTDNLVQSVDNMVQSESCTGADDTSSFAGMSAGQNSKVSKMSQTDFTPYDINTVRDGLITLLVSDKDSCLHY